MAADTNQVRRYYVDQNNQKQTLPAYAPEEALEIFRVRDNGFSDHYTLIYEYVPPGTGEPVQMERDIYILFQKGDVNRDGEIDLFDEQALANHLNHRSVLDLSDALYLSKTVDVDGNGTISAEDRYRLRDNSLGLTLIEQDYLMPVP